MNIYTCLVLPNKLSLVLVGPFPGSESPGTTHLLGQLHYMYVVFTRIHVYVCIVTNF